MFDITLVLLKHHFDVAARCGVANIIDLIVLW